MIDEALIREVDAAMAGAVTYSYEIGGYGGHYMVLRRNRVAIQQKYLGSPPAAWSIWMGRRWAKRYIKAARKVDQQR